MWKKILLVVVGALALSVVGVLVAASTRPDTMKVAREIDVAAPPSAVFPTWWIFGAGQPGHPGRSWIRR